MSRPRFEVAEVVRRYGPEFLKGQGAAVPCQHRRVLRNIERCRTAALGGHVEACDRCGARQISYNSCRNRHCPKCQSLAKAKWLEARLDELLPVEYFHVVFTLPGEVARIARCNQRLIYNLLFRATAETLRTIAADPKHLGAEIGFLAILHSWGQTLSFHPHLHCVVPAGGFDRDRSRWVGCRPGFFLPVRVLSRLFRRRFLEALEREHRRGELLLKGPLEELEQAEVFQRWLQNQRRTEWVVYAKKPFAGPEKVLDYLGRYTHRIAISNHRLTAIQDGKVSFRWRDYRRKSRQRTMTLAAGEFLRRFLMHVLPPGFVRIRYFGLLAHRHRKSNLELARKLLQAPTPTDAEEAAPTDCKTFYEKLTGRDPTVCPQCRKGRLVRCEGLAAEPANLPIFDSS